MAYIQDVNEDVQYVWIPYIKLDLHEVHHNTYFQNNEHDNNTKETGMIIYLPV